MSPLGHLGLGVLAGRWRGYDRRGRLHCLIGAFLPDLVDKPLGALGLVPSFHTVGHSLLLAGVAALVVAGTGRGEALLVGWVSHLAGDLPLAVPTYLDHYVWPVAAPPAPPPEPPGSYVAGYVTGPAFAAELLVAGAALAWVLAARRSAGRGS
ncbi:MAG: metal-dependent hydrolase [Haloglomus sp.]